jgi:aryl-alcohol dehydrogenase-like predicted oxidoreductase
VLVVGLGTSGLGPKRDLTFLARSIALGVHFVDTSPMYGLAEEILGSVKLPSEVRLCTKFGLNHRRLLSYGALALPINSLLPSSKLIRYSHLNSSFQDMEIQIRNSLKRLRVDSVDTLLYHCPRDNDELSWAREILTYFRSIGIVERIGFSTDHFMPSLSTDWCDVIEVPVEGHRWYRGDVDLILNRIFGGTRVRSNLILDVEHASREVTLLTGSTDERKIREFYEYVSDIG